MRKLLLLSAFAFATIFMNSCGGGLSAQMKKSSRLYCEMRDLLEADPVKNKEKIQKLAEESMDISRKIFKKYEDKMESKEFKKAYDDSFKELEKCGLTQHKMNELYKKLKEAGIDVFK